MESENNVQNENVNDATDDEQHKLQLIEENMKLIHKTLTSNNCIPGQNAMLCSNVLLGL